MANMFSRLNFMRSQKGLPLYCLKVVGNMSDDLLGIVTKYNCLAKAHSGSAVRVKDKTLFPFLAFCLSSEDASLEVIDLAIDTLILFAKNDCNVSQMKRTYGVFEAVELIASRHDIPEHVKEKATELLEKKDCKEYPAYCTRSQTKTERDQDKKARRVTKMFTLHVHGLNKDCGGTVSSAVVRVAGVVSVVLDVDHQRCSVLCYEGARPSDIAAAIYDKAGLKAQLVNKNRFGQEFLVPLLENLDDCSVSLPPYLREEDSPVREKAVSQMFLIKDKTANWVNSAVGFFQKSFYW